MMPKKHDLRSRDAERSSREFVCIKAISSTITSESPDYYTMNEYLQHPTTLPAHDATQRLAFQSSIDVDDDMSSMSELHSLREAWIEFRERQILEQYYATSQVLKHHVRGGSFIAKAAGLSPTKAAIKVKTL
ncbi:hypothetical protein MPSEU_000739900 [Mayamaea pseudoterrestris]|nr:hypothetical protein MPSEU_000739900 [Mayamaea pseudoterrestris]